MLADLLFTHHCNVTYVLNIALLSAGLQLRTPQRILLPLCSLLHRLVPCQVHVLFQLHINIWHDCYGLLLLTLSPRGALTESGQCAGAD